MPQSTIFGLQWGDFMQQNHYYKTKEDVIRYGISFNEISEDDAQCIPISEEEYLKAMAELKEKINTVSELPESEQDAKENPALFLQMLTGEEYTAD